MSKKNRDSAVNEVPNEGEQVEINIETNEHTSKEAEVEENDKEAQQPDMEKKVAELKAINVELKDKMLRLNAEFDNFRKRMNRQQIENVKLASKSIITELLPVIDDFERAFKNAPEDAEKSDATGMELIKNKLLAVLQSKGLKPMETVGEPFDSNFHEAVAEIPAPSDDMKGKVIDEMEKGYYLNETIIRYAKVIVGK